MGMTDPAAPIDALDWQTIAAQLDEDGWAPVPGLLDTDQAGKLAGLADDPARIDCRLDLAGAGLGSGELLYLAQALPQPLAAWRCALYRQLQPIAERWHAALGLPAGYPRRLDAFLAQNRQAGQGRSLSALSRLGDGGYRLLQQAAEGERVFPLLLVALCSAPGRDFTGGEFVLTEQRPRMQSRPIVLPLRQGDAALIAAGPRPCRGARGPYRAVLRHAVSRVRSGTRIGLELLLHDGC